MSAECAETAEFIFCTVRTSSSAVQCSFLRFTCFLRHSVFDYYGQLNFLALYVYVHNITNIYFILVSNVI